MEKKKQEIIDRYLLDDFSEEERIAFEQQMAEDESLQEEVEMMRHIATAFERKGEAKALEELQQIESKEELLKILNKKPQVEVTSKMDVQPQPQTKTIPLGTSEKKEVAKSATPVKSWWKPIVSIAAVALVFIYIGFQPKYSGPQLFDEYYSAEDFEVMHGRGDFSDDEMDQIMLYMESLHLIGTNQTSELIDNLNYLSSIENFEYREETEWELALVYLSENKMQEAKELLSDIAQSNSFYNRQAQEVLGKLNEKRWF